MHIPDGFLSTPLWAGLNAAAVPAVGYCVRRAQANFEDSRVPLLGVMGAFVFAAQMINVPTGVGPSGHLIGGALLAFTLGPSAATVVMTAILVLQALVFQDGGILALGANIVNMAVVGVWVGYMPMRLFGRRGASWRRAAAFAGGWLSLVAAAALMSLQLSLSGVAPAGPMFASILGLHAVAGLFEGAVTAAALAAIERLDSGFVLPFRAS